MFINLICGNKNEATAEWIVKSFPVIKIILISLLMICSIAMIVLVLMQKSNQNGINSITGQSNTFYNRNKGATLQGKIKVWTIVCAICIMVCVVIYLIISQIYTEFI